MKIPRYHRRRKVTIVAAMIIGMCTLGLVVSGWVRNSLADTVNASKQSSASLQALVDTFSSGYGNRVGVVVTDLSTGVTGTDNADEKFVSASLYKLFVAYGIYQKIDNGTLEYTSSLKKYGASNTVDTCLNLMITISDNTCGKALGTLLDWAKLDQMLHTQGYTNTLMNNYYADGSFNGDKMTTPNDVALLLKRLYSGTLLGADSTNRFMALLKADEINTYLPSGLPSGTVIAHKIGYIYGYVHDAGVIYGPHKNVLVVMMTGQWANPTATAPGVFAKLSSSVWAWMGQN